MIKLDFYKSVVLSQSGVLEMVGKPGTGKTAILESLAKGMNWLYIDIRLAQRDEGEVAGIPDVTAGKQYYDMMLPKWVERANNAIEDGYDGCLVVFEELNRASLAVRNASLQILNERRVGDMLNLAPHVYLASTGNLGDEDNTEVENFDAAQRGRLVRVKHDLTIPEWKEQYAKDNVLSQIVTYLENNPANIYDDEALKNDEGAYASHRSWTNLSMNIMSTYMTDEERKKYFSVRNLPENKFQELKKRTEECILDWQPRVTEYATPFVGGSIALNFSKYLQDNIAVSIKDVLKQYSRVADKVVKMDRARISELISQAKKLDYNELKSKEWNNIISFLTDISKSGNADEVMPVLEEISSKCISKYIFPEPVEIEDYFSEKNELDEFIVDDNGERIITKRKEYLHIKNKSIYKHLRKVAMLREEYDLQQH